MTGTTISHYRIVKELGKGGMGVVYKAEDTKLDRTVALKLLAPHMLSSESDRARFYREARAAAALHHPNIATIFEIDETGDGSPFIAMEYVDGAQLDDGLKLKPLPVDEAIAIAVQIAEALKAAHDGGIVHRDIKSANIMLTKDGVAKVLDFGLAKTDASTKLTQMGSTVGTIAYMSPEQARGEEVDHRTDLWSLGTVLYEMLTGQLPFPGAYEQAVVYGILNAEAEPVTSLRTAVGAEVELIVQKCLRKERDHRYQSAADLLADLKSLDLTVSGRSKTSKAPGPRGSRVSTPKWVWGALAAAALLGFAGAWIVKRPADVHPRPLRRVDLQVGSASEAIAIAPDGRLIVTVSDDEGYSAYDTETATWVRELDVRFGWRHEFSPSGEWLLNSGGPTAPGLARLRVSDNRSVPILNDGMGATWLTENTVLFTSSVDSSLWRVDIDGENAALVASKDYARGHVGLYFPDVLPGGDFAVAHGWSGQSRDVVLADLRTGEYEVLIREAACVKYLASGHLLYVDGGQMTGEVMVRPFDANARRFAGNETPSGLGQQSCGYFAVGRDGTVGYASATELTGRSYYWIGADGSPSERLPGLSELDGGSGSRSNRPRVSPDGGRVANAVQSQDGSDIYIHNQADMTSRRLTFSGRATSPIWSPDGEWIYFVRDEDANAVITRKRSDLSGAEDSTVVGRLGSEPAISSNGEWLAFYDYMSQGIRVVELADTTNSFLVGDSDAGMPALSPNGRYLAIESDNGIVVHEVDGDGLVQVSTDSRSQAYPEWSADGRFLYFSSAGALHRIPVETSPVFDFRSPETVLDVGGFFHFSLQQNGERILILGPETASDAAFPDLSIAFNWFTRLKEIAPPRQ